MTEVRKVPATAQFQLAIQVNLPLNFLEQGHALDMNLLRHELVEQVLDLFHAKCVEVRAELNVMDPMVLRPEIVKFNATLSEAPVPQAEPAVETYDAFPAEVRRPAQGD